MSSSLLRYQQGVGLVEVLVTMLILGTSLLAISTLQARSLEQNHDAFLHTQVNIIAYDLIDRVRLQNGGPESSVALVVPPAAEITAATALLPGGNGTVVCDTARLCTVTINWSENSGTNSGGLTSTFIYSTSL